MGSQLEDRLSKYAATVDLGKGNLSVFLKVTEHARDLGLPLRPEDLLTTGGGQVRGVGFAAMRKALARHGIDATLAREAGRTSRGSLGHMSRYVAFLNQLGEEGLFDFDAIDAFWIGRVREVLAAKPFQLKLDANRGLRSSIRDLLAQAVKRQRSAPGRTDAGAVLQHLVGATLDDVIQPGSIQHNSYSTADAPTARQGDFEVGDTVVHVTTAPGSALIDRCQQNLDDGFHPLLVTLSERVAVASSLAEDARIAERFDILDIEQFLAQHLYERHRFHTGDRRATLEKVITRYNEIVKAVETDPGLQIDFR